MKLFRRSVITASLLSICVVAGSAGETLAQERVDGVILNHGILGQTSMPDEFLVQNASGIKGAKKIAIAVFNVAFPRENHFTASSRSSGFGSLSTSASASLKTTLSGVDQATMQRIADAAYRDFVSDLQQSGFEVVDAAELAQMAPEYSRWKASANFADGRFGAYVAPSGRSVYFLQGDAASRDTSGMFGQQLSLFRVLDRTEAFTRAPYLAHDANVGIVAVTLVLDYGVYSSSGERHGLFKGASVGFAPGLTVAAGNNVDRGSVLEYWGQSSGGFPSDVFLQLPVRSSKEFATINSAGEADAELTADPVKYEEAAGEVSAIAMSKFSEILRKAK